MAALLPRVQYREADELWAVGGMIRGQSPSEAAAVGAAIASL
jgi:hypothetical protein